MKNKFSIRLKEMREERGLSQSKIARDLKISNFAISMWEAGKRTPSLEYLVLLADYFEVSIYFLIGRED